jgi:hypothetical protein
MPTVEAVSRLIRAYPGSHMLMLAHPHACQCVRRMHPMHPTSGNLVVRGRKRPAGLFVAKAG